MLLNETLLTRIKVPLIQFALFYNRGKKNLMVSGVTGEEPTELLVEPCAINAFDIDPQNPSVSLTKWKTFATLQISVAQFSCFTCS